MKIYIDGTNKVLESAGDESLLETLRKAGLVIDAPCGGQGKCGKCRLTIKEEGSHASKTVAACQYKPQCGSSASISVSLNTKPGAIAITHVKKNEIGTFQLPGLALDIGTTTVDAALVGPGGMIATIALPNDQKVYGADVMSRIGACCGEKDGRDNLHILSSLIRNEAQAIINAFQIDTFQSKTAEKLPVLAVAGNTTMLHLFLGEDPGGMAGLPFKPAFLDARSVEGSALGLSVDKVQTLPCLAAFIGADIMAGLACLDKPACLCKPERHRPPFLLLDLGTNAEMALVLEDRIICTSAAAGPALEGAGISCGMGGLKGAVSRVSRENGALKLDVIGGSPAHKVEPCGICGAGLVDAVALMLDEKVIDGSGAFTKGSEWKLAETKDCGKNLSITARDVRQFQLAKGAILSGVELLLRKAGLDERAVNTVYLAGGLGYYINPESAVKTGLLPAGFEGRIAAAGNLSLEGAARSLTEPDFIDYCTSLRSKCRVMDLAKEPDFMDCFADAMSFPEGSNLLKS
jgi:uncharacterized 2Fe-2S/4Fe-4S cluster protein (DUF4445 family)